jgi:hypothetical protein
MRLGTRLPPLPYPMNKRQEKNALDNRQRTAVKEAGMAIKTFIGLLVSLTLASVHLAQVQQGKLLKEIRTYIDRTYSRYGPPTPTSPVP